MKYQNVLKKIESNEITPEEALDLLYSPKSNKPGKKANFVKLRIQVPEEGKGINTLLRVLFAIPFPLIIARIGLRFGKRFIKTDDVDINELLKIIKYSKGTKISVDSPDAKIDIKII